MVRSPDMEWHWTTMVVPQGIWELFFERRDHLIGIQELLAVCLALGTFAELLEGQKLLCWVDNMGVVGSLLKGSASHCDANLVIAKTWLRLAAMNVAFAINYVHTKANVADGPSREDYTLVEDLGAV